MINAHVLVPCEVTNALYLIKRKKHYEKHDENLWGDLYLKKYKALNGKMPIYARITIDGKRVDLSVKQY